MSEVNHKFEYKNFRMLKRLYKRYPFYVSLIAVLILQEINKTWFEFTLTSPKYEAKMILLNLLLEFISFLPLIFLLIQAYKWTIGRNNKVLFSLCVVVFNVFGPCILLFFITRLEIIFFADKAFPFTLELLIKFTPARLNAFLFLSATLYLTHLQLLYAKQREVANKSETLAKEVQVKMLRYQINPHFLFNVLNSIHALIDENKVKAKKLVVEMSDYYRYTLSKQQQTIPIGEEVEAVVKYLEIQKMRFEDELHYEVFVDDAAKKALIPSFVIHLLVENAVKYGIMMVEQRLVIHLSAKLTGRNLNIMVSNTGKLKETPNGEKISDGTGSGIDNIMNRLTLIYDNGYTFSLKEENGWVIASIEIKNIQIQ